MSGAPLLFLGTHEPSWIGRSHSPLFVSAVRAARFGRRSAVGGWALDSGGFTALHHGGWTTPPEAYVELVYRLADRCPGMIWAAPQDWMCEPSAVAATGLDVESHMRLTVENLLALRELDERRLIIPVVQGWAAGDHERCVRMYDSLGVDLRSEALVGVGTVCRRQATAEIEGIFRDLSSEGLRMHGFGVKTLGLRRYGRMLVSADSLAWSYRARSAALHGEGRMCRTGTHASCQNCFEWAHQWRDGLVGAGVAQ